MKLLKMRRGFLHLLEDGVELERGETTQQVVWVCRLQPSLRFRRFLEKLVD